MNIPTKFGSNCPSDLRGFKLTTPFWIPLGLLLLLCNSNQQNQIFRGPSNEDSYQVW
jgi:hypothetical protein